MFAATKGLTMPVVCVGLLIGVAGCNLDGRWAHSGAPREPARLAAHSGGAAAGDSVDISIVEANEVDLVEATLDHRTRYRQNLERLQDYYEAHGYMTKANWAAFELEGLGRVKQFSYLLDAEVPSDALHPNEQIPEADALYEKARELMQRGGHGVPVFYRQDRMIEAARLFRELIERFPSSDKIDDAAFFCGEIHKEYLPGQETIAVRWYERTWTWSPETEHPARFQAATIYDYRLHDRDRALELYQDVLTHEAQHRSNVRFASRRIHALTADSDGTAEASRTPP